MPKDAGPGWNYLSIIFISRNGSNVEWKCSCCKSLFNDAASRIRAHIAGRGQQGISYNTKSVNIVEEPFVEEDTMEEHTVISKLLLL